MKTRLLIHPDELTKKKIDIFKNLGLDIISIHPAGGETAHESLMNMLLMFEDEKFLKLIDYIKDSGMEVEYEMHAASFLLPRNLFDTHPEYFRFDGEKRVKELNFCVSNQEAVDICVKNAVNLIKKLYKSNPVYYIWLDDVEGKSCKCEKCREMSPSVQQLKIMNLILKEIKKEIPSARLAYLAYHDTMEVPKGEKAEEGIFLEYAPIERNFEKGASGMTEEEKEKLNKLIEFFGRESASVLEYWYDNSFLSKWKKPPLKFIPDNEIIKKDIAFYKNLGFDDIGSFACFLGDDYEEMWGEADYSAFKK